MHLVMLKVAQAMALLGALVLSMLIVMTCVSVLGREMNALFNSAFMETNFPALSTWALEIGVAPITGDFELLENLMPLAVFAFLPLAHIHSSHATVDVFTTRFSVPVLAWMRAVTEIVFAFVLVLFSFKLFEGTQAKMRYGETTYLIQFPVWWAYASAFCASAAAAVVGIYVACVRLYEAWTGKTLIATTAGAEL